MATKTEVLRESLEQYLKASRKEKGIILDHLTAILGLRRKSVIRRLKNGFAKNGNNDYGVNHLYQIPFFICLAVVKILQIAVPSIKSTPPTPELII